MTSIIEEKLKNINEREKNMEKIIKTFEYKIQLREKEILEADIQVDNDNFKKVIPSAKEPKVDPFFQTIDMHPVEKRVVQRDGLIPKLKKNIDWNIRYYDCSVDISEAERRRI